jgi:hypothetical protein
MRRINIKTTLLYLQNVRFLLIAIVVNGKHVLVLNIQGGYEYETN